MNAVLTPARQRWLLGHYHYPIHHRVFELLVVGMFATVGWRFTWRVGAGVADEWRWWSLAPLLAAVVAAYALSDVLSGLVHRAFDTLGSPDTPIIGQKFVKPFRDHHDDPLAMTHGDPIAVNADNVFASLLLLAPTAWLLDERDHPIVGAFVLALLAGIVATNQIHKWCHTPTVPAFVARAQRLGVILSPGHHDVHHRPPHGTHYCITWGRMDAVVDLVGARRRSPAPDTTRG